MAEADAVLYDCLANAALLAYTRREAERILVGRRAGKVVVDQPQINDMLVRLARAGRRVVRLKGGDPFVYARGTEEVEAVLAAGIALEIVPGVTAGLAGLAYAGVPATDRDLASTLTFVTGQESEGKHATNICWDALARLGGTLVFYMGILRLRSIAERLIEAGLDPKTPACVIEWATLPRQRTVTGTVESIADAAERAAIRPPGLACVGKVVSRRATMDWLSHHDNSNT